MRFSADASSWICCSIASLACVSLSAGDADPVAIALEALLAAGTEAPPVVAALALADTWRDLHQQILALDAGVSEEEHAAEQRVADARQAVPSLDDIRLTLGKQTVCFGDTVVTARRVGHHFDVTVHHPVFEEIPVEAQLQITYLALDAALGEVDVETWIGEIEPAALAPLDAFPLQHLARLVADLREELTDADGSPTWVMLQGSGPEGPVLAVAQVPLAPTAAPELDEHVAVAASYDQVTDDGLPSDGSLEALRSLEDRLATVLGGRGRLVAHESSGGRRTLHFYVDSATGATRELLEEARGWRHDGAAGVVDTAAEPDPGWSAVRHLRA